MRRILAICTSHIGGVLLMTPAIELLRHFFPDAEISALVREGTEVMLQNNPAVKQIYAEGKITSNQEMYARSRSPLRRRLLGVPGGLKLALELRRQRFDLVVDFSGSDRGAIFAFLSGARERVGYTPKGGFFGKGRLFTRICPRAAGPRHKVLKNADLVFYVAAAFAAATEKKPEIGRLVFRPLPEDLVEAESEWAAIARPGQARVMIHPASRVRYKCWAPEKWARVIDRLQREAGAAVLLTCSDDMVEIDMIGAIADLCRIKPNVRLGGMTLSGLGALIRSATLFLGVDSAPMHMAAGVGTPVVAVFGPSQDKLWSPWGSEHQVVRHPCHCLETGRKQCDESKGMDCLRAIETDEVWRAAKEKLALSSGVAPPKPA